MIALTAPTTGTLCGVAIGIVLTVIFIWRSGSLNSHQLTFRSGAVSLTANRKVIFLSAATLVLLIGLIGVGIVVGDFDIGVRDAVATVLWRHGGEYDFIVNTLRVPRILVAVLAGAALAGSGAIFQGLIGNPLMSPDVIGINQGAAAVAFFVLVVSDDIPIGLLPVAAFAGALITAAVIYLLAWRNGMNAARLIVVGIAMNAMLSAAISFMQVRYPIERVANAARWQAGSLFGAGWADVRTLAVGLSILGPITLMFVGRLRVLQLGDDTASALGQRVERDRLILVALGSALAALAVSVVGPLGFVALLVPHMARLMAGNLTTGVLAFTALLGALMLLGADLIAQRLFAPTSLPAGVVTGALGGPYFLYLLYRYNRSI